MVELIVGKKGKGKTKVLLDKVNGAVKEANGSIVYLDKRRYSSYNRTGKRRTHRTGTPNASSDSCSYR